MGVAVLGFQGEQGGHIGQGRCGVGRRGQAGRLSRLGQEAQWGRGPFVFIYFFVFVYSFSFSFLFNSLFYFIKFSFYRIQKLYLKEH